MKLDITKQTLDFLKARHHSTIYGVEIAGEQTGIGEEMARCLASINDGTYDWPERRTCLIDFWRRARLHGHPVKVRSENLAVPALTELDRHFGTDWRNKFAKWWESERKRRGMV